MTLLTSTGLEQVVEPFKAGLIAAIRQLIDPEAAAVYFFLS
jgi:hypothetical protein